MDYSLIIKLTNNCNLNCTYCYHRHDISRDLEQSLSKEQLEIMTKNILEHNEKYAEFIWHGGEPLLSGKEVFKDIVEMQARYNTKGLKIRNSVQTNGTLLDKEFIDFFISNNFSIGISIDGPFDLHSSERNTLLCDYEKICLALDYLNMSSAKYGALCVVGKQHRGQANRIFDMICDHKIGNIGFLPCIVQNLGVVDTSLSIEPEEYAYFMIDLFEVWIHSHTRGLSVRNFDDAIRFFRGKAAKTCISCNICDRYLTVTPNGGIYLCDNFSSNEEHLVGNIVNGFDGIPHSKAMKWLQTAMEKVPEACINCRYYNACHAGCKYYRWLIDPMMNGKQYYCKAYRMLYDHIGYRLSEEGD